MRALVVGVLKQGSAFLLDSGGKRRLVVAIAFQSTLSYSISVDSVEVGSSGNEQPRSWSAWRNAVRSSRETSLILCDILPKIRTALVPSLCAPSTLSPAVKVHRAKRSPYDKLDLRLHTAQTQLEHTLLRDTITPIRGVCKVKMRFLGPVFKHRKITN